MVKLKNFLLDNVKGTGIYALVTYDKNIQPTWFNKYWSDVDNQPWFLESPCELCRICKVDKSIDKFCKEYIDEYIKLEEGKNVDDYIEEFVKPMIIDGWFYEIVNFQTEPYLPKEVENIKLISERECLEWMLDKVKNNE
ncbi:hypothetical protein FDB61_15775 [Clostridium botulinum]|nr:hypothetical protein [Clostridium botulinum]